MGKIRLKFGKFPKESEYLSKWEWIKPSFWCSCFVLVLITLHILDMGVLANGLVLVSVSLVEISGMLVIRHRILWIFLLILVVFHVLLVRTLRKTLSITILFVLFVLVISQILLVWRHFYNCDSKSFPSHLYAPKCKSWKLNKFLSLAWNENETTF